MPRRSRPKTESDTVTPFCTVGFTVCRIKVFTESQWAALADEDRPATHQHVPGLGWVTAIPVEILN